MKRFLDTPEDFTIYPPGEIPPPFSLHETPTEQDNPTTVNNP